MSVKKWYDDLSSKMQKAVATGIVTVLLSSTGGTGYVVFAKASDFNEHIAAHKKEDSKKRLNVLEEQMLEYREMFGRKLENATEQQKKRYLKWEIEVEILWKEMEVKG